ncbi:ParB N-terminal domain-containing protein [Vallitalea pronyensis]|uniref:ParB N-terminal domain-containing protein n=1 Tax=Vallitalea pronyensis TaxID=1348613 RepID=A0A8J8MJ49_9FIRM|nr:ParB/RepB/Spo0J family partition protein [Vallitalea pronyensis]QUI22599.1 ParB N-terminal domain-containing protein [Vallitalea pronyensis]
MRKNKKFTFSVEEARWYGSNHKIEQWVHSFLTTIGNNRGFSDGLKLQKRYWLGPVLCDLNMFGRCCGPEDGLKYYEPLLNFEERVKKMQLSIRDGWEVPPLIVNHNKGKFELNDGNHRYEALRRLDIHMYWVIFWDSDNHLHTLKERIKR